VLCFGAKQDLPIEVPPYGSAAIRLCVQVNKPVVFDEQLELLVADAHTTRIIPLSIRGKGVESAAAKD